MNRAERERMTKSTTIKYQAIGIIHVFNLRWSVCVWYHRGARVIHMIQREKTE